MDSLKIIVFDFPGDRKDYYEVPYIKESMSSWKRELPEAEIVHVNAQEIVLNSKSRHTKHVLEYRGYCNYLTDTLRFEAACNYNNCLYLDTDIYLIEGAGDLIRETNEKYNFYVSMMSTCFFYNKFKNESLLDSIITTYDNFQDYTGRLLYDSEMYRYTKLKHILPNVDMDAYLFHGCNTIQLLSEVYDVTPLYEEGYSVRHNGIFPKNSQSIYQMMATGKKTSLLKPCPSYEEYLFLAAKPWNKFMLFIL